MAQESSFGRESDQISKIKDKASDQFNQVVSQAEDMAHRVANQGREAGESMQKVAGNFKSAIDSSVRDQPMATLAFAAMLGFVLGALWKS
jgi:ElaB/YqjD/DUF883 family membrane-anchored ribosome-binding protein